jgi:hypothetical protein
MITTSANTKMKRILGGDIQTLASMTFELPQPLLLELDGAEFIEIGGLVVLKGSYKPTGAVNDPDPTGTECSINKWHIEDLLQTTSYSESFLAKAGIRFAQEIRTRLLATLIQGEFRVIVSVTDPLDDSLPLGCTVRCHKRRPENPWLREDLEGYENEALLVIDWINSVQNTQES